MKIVANENNIIQFENVFVPIKLVTAWGESLYISMRDSGFEIEYENKKYENKKYELKEGEVR